MRYFKSLSDGYIYAIGTGPGGTEITEAEYNDIKSVIDNMPQAESGYRLKMDQTWELYELPAAPEDADQELTAEEALNIIVGGEGT